eukprot:gene12005-16073_t
MSIARAKAAREKKEKKQADHLQLKVLKPGDALNYCNFGDTVSLHYVGYLEDGTCFDNSYSRSQPIYFILGAGQVIRAFEQALSVMSRGEKVKIVVPPEDGYGDKGYPPIIPPRSTLVYEIELIGFSSVGQAERLHREKKAQQDAT